MEEITKNLMEKSLGKLRKTGLSRDQRNEIREVLISLDRIFNYMNLCGSYDPVQTKFLAEKFVNMDKTLLQTAIDESKDIQATTIRKEYSQVSMKTVRLYTSFSNSFHNYLSCRCYGKFQAVLPESIRDWNLEEMIDEFESAKSTGSGSNRTDGNNSGTKNHHFDFNPRNEAKFHHTTRDMERSL